MTSRSAAGPRLVSSIRYAAIAPSAACGGPITLNCIFDVAGIVLGAVNAGAGTGVNGGAVLGAPGGTNGGATENGPVAGGCTPTTGASRLKIRAPLGSNGDRRFAQPESACASNVAARHARQSDLWMRIVWLREKARERWVCVAEKHSLYMKLTTAFADGAAF